MINRIDIRQDKVGAPPDRLIPREMLLKPTLIILTPSQVDMSNRTAIGQNMTNPTE